MSPQTVKSSGSGLLGHGAAGQGNTVMHSVLLSVYIRAVGASSRARQTRCLL